MTVLRIDIETYSSIDLRACGVHRYAESDDFEVMLFGYALDNNPVQVVDLTAGNPLPPEILEALFDPAVTKTAYNASFELACLSKHFGRPLDVSQWRCTSVHALYLGLPGNLGDVGRVVGLEPDKQKLSIGGSLIRFFCIPCKPTLKNGGRTRNLPKHEPEKWQLFKDYCARDVETERAISERIDKFPLPEVEQRLWVLDQKMNSTGIKVDRQLVEAAIECDNLYRDRLMHEAVELTGLENPNSRSQLIDWLEEAEGVEIDDLTKKTVPKLLANTDSDVVRRVLEIRQELAKTSVAKYHAMARAMCSDDTIRGLTQFYGANRTGRWAGRLVQVQNLPQNKLRDIDSARQLVRRREFDALEMLYGNVPDTLSQLIRTAFTARPEHKLVVVDFSAIEARVIAWLAWCEWRMAVFNGNGKIYEASAEKMFKLPAGSVTKKSPYRQKGKVAELALGYQGGAGALKTMGALEMGITEEELEPIKRAWRDANHEIVDLWYACESSARKAVEEKRSIVLPVAGGRSQVTLSYESGFLFAELPSGRRLAYVKPRIEEADLRRGEIVIAREGSLTYEGLDQKTKQWSRLSTYGGKLCVAEGALVLSLDGWKPIEYITPVDKVWDGVEWVSTDGAICNGTREVIEAYGAWMTPDHEVLSEEGWIHASQSEGHIRAACRLPDGVEIPRQQRAQVHMGGPLRLRRGEAGGRQRLSETGQARRDGVVRLPKEADHIEPPQDARHEQTPGVCGVALHVRSLRAALASGLAQLRRTGHSGVRALAGSVRELLGGHGSLVPVGAYLGPEGQRRPVLAGQLPLGDIRDSSQQQTGCDSHTDPERAHDGQGARRRAQFKCVDGQLQGGARRDVAGDCNASRRVAPVYDLVNCGPRSRFVIWAGGAPLIVHNCENLTQAIARDCLREAMLRLDEYEFRQLTTVHDEIVIECPSNQALCLHKVEAVMGTPIDWAPDLPLRGDGFETPYYMKEID